MLKYYKYCCKYFIYEKFSNTFIDRIFYCITNKFLSPPKNHFPMKYNSITEEFDLFYTRKEIC